LGKRIKGDGDDIEVSESNDISDLYNQLRNDAMRKK